MSDVHQHFESEAAQFDGIIQKLIPYYDEMVEALISALSFPTACPIRVLDLGCGTGTIGERVLRAFPRAELTCVDFSEQMIQMAKCKLATWTGVSYVTADFRDFEWEQPYDAVVSSLALHHLPTDDHKREFYSRIFRGLRAGGCFYNADVVLASSAAVQDAYLEKWRAFMRMALPDAEIEQTWLPKYRAEDHPAPLSSHMEWLRTAGFKDVDVIWKYYNFAVFGGVAP